MCSIEFENVVQSGCIIYWKYAINPQWSDHIQALIFVHPRIQTSIKRRMKVSVDGAFALIFLLKQFPILFLVFVFSFNRCCYFGNNIGYGRNGIRIYIHFLLLYFSYFFLFCCRNCDGEMIHFMNCQSRKKNGLSELHRNAFPLIVLSPRRVAPTKAIEWRKNDGSAFLSPIDFFHSAQRSFQLEYHLYTSDFGFLHCLFQIFTILHLNTDSSCEKQTEIISILKVVYWIYAYFCVFCSVFSSS